MVLDQQKCILLKIKRVALKFIQFMKSMRQRVRERERESEREERESKRE